MAFDPYYTWLGIPPHEQPPNHYRLLGVSLFEPQAEVIDNGADRQMAHVRSFQTGPNAADSQRLLNAISLARVTLLDPRRRAEYDAQLRAQFASPVMDTQLAAYYPPSTYVAPVAPTYYPASTPGYAPPAAPYMPVAPGGVAPQPMPAMPTPLTPPVAVAPPVSAGTSTAVPVGSTAMHQSAVREEEPNVRGPAVFESASASPSIAMRRRKRKNPAVEAAKIVVGGLAGLVIGAAVLHYGFDVTSSRQTTEATSASMPPSDGPPPATATATTTTTTGKPPPEEREPASADSVPAAQPPAPKVPNVGAASKEVQGPLRLNVEGRRDKKREPSGQLCFDVRLTQRGGAEVALQDLTLRYWYKHPGSPPQFWCDAASVGAGRVMYRFITMNDPVDSADGFCEVGFLASAGTLAAGSPPIELKLRFTLPDDESLDPSRDHSLVPESDTFAKVDRITVYQAGKLVAGQEPAAVAGRQIVVAGGGVAEVARAFGELAEPEPMPRLPQVQRIAPPSEESLAKALAEVDQVFRTSEKRNRAERVELAKKIAATAKGAEQRPDEYFALLKRAAEAAQAAGEAKLVGEYVDRLDARFDIDAPLLRFQLLLRTIDVVNDEGRLQQVVAAARDAICDLVLTDRYDEALKLADRSVELCRETIGKNSRKIVTDGRNQLRGMNQRWHEVQKARQTLETQADDVAAHGVVGRWLCLQDDNWSAGLEHLAQGSDARLAELARADRAGADLADKQLEMAERWYDYCQSAPAHLGYAARALDWYEKAFEQLDGLAKTKAEERMKELRAELASYDQTNFSRRYLITVRPATRRPGEISSVPGLK